METIITKENFDKEILAYNGKAIVDFWAEWCGPCKMMLPIIEELSEELTDVKVCKVNCDDERDLAIQFGINAIPCIIYFNNGEEVDRIIGLTSKESLKELVK